MIGVIGEGISLKIHRDRLSLIYNYAPYLMTYLKNNCVWRFYFLKKVNVQIHTFFIWVKRTRRFVDGSLKSISQTSKISSRSTGRAHNCPPLERGPQFGHLLPINKIYSALPLYFVTFLWMPSGCSGISGRRRNSEVGTYYISPPLCPLD